jgi:glycosyltransferase involved in cell wall biosynthesis
MAVCRIYLFTYKRNELLVRAIKSLTDQTFQDWVCEVHNDDPHDKFPAEHIVLLNDPRFVIKHHVVNLGPTASFNLAFAGCNETYASILEDDNWWEPEFLKEMIAIMDNYPTLNIAWSNMYLWQEQPGNEWTNTGKTTWPVKNEYAFFDWGNLKQAMGALYSNGAMVFRGKLSESYLVPDNCDFNAMEAIRERTFKFPIGLNHKPLANFAQTITTNRSGIAYKWTACQIMLLSSFIEAHDNKNAIFKKTLAYYRSQKPSPIINFFLATTLLLKKPQYLKYFTFNDWIKISKWLVKSYFIYGKLGEYLLAQQNVYTFLLQKTHLQNPSDNAAN